MWRALGLSALAVALACRSDDRAATGAAHVTARKVTISNIARADYVGPEVCGGCHADEFARWSLSLHRMMNAKASDPGAVVGDFGGAAIEYRGEQARFTRDGSGYAMEIGALHYRVTRTIGRRGLQEYVGVADGSDVEVRLPFGWWPRAGGWAPQIAFDPWLAERDYDPAQPVREPWAARCPWCHSTYPFAQRIARASAPEHLGHGMEQWFESAAGSDVLAVGEQVTTGISCESCHLGGRAHATGTGALHFVPQGASAAVTAANVPDEPFDAERKDARVVNAVCAQCHSGPSPRLADGTALRNSSEAIDLAASPCTGIKCTDCHDPHRADSRGDTARANAACVACHEPLADALAAQVHAGDGHAGATCLDCHMPRIVMGIDRFVRTHRISSPTNPDVLAKAEPNACNACHLDRGIDWTIAALARGWSVRLDPSSWTRAYGALDRPVGEVWLASAQPALRVLAAELYGDALPDAARAQLQRDPLPFVRAWTARAPARSSHRLQ